ncbi:MAG: STAS domain-containing protein [Chitinispirillales bacterium]|jgi:anti-anti-sigma factor|nr:STAS domain-containing protein [Chitinispirillales bacterium]
MALEVSLISEAENPVLELTGKIIDIDVKKLQHKMDQLYKKKAIPRIVLDVSLANFIDSHGVGTIVYYHTLLQRENRRLVILNANPDPKAYLNNLFELTNLDKVLNIVKSLE